MTSSQSLLGLVNQLQNMEVSFATILMEAAMKLSALTDANIFVLIETQEGRKFSGKRHLCDAYLRGGLGPIGNDVEFEVDPTVTAVREKLPNGQDVLRSVAQPGGFSSQGQAPFQPNQLHTGMR
jgi:hypothetical protein